MDVLIFLGIIIYAIVSSSKKAAKEAEATTDTPSLDDIFKEAVKSAKKSTPDPHNGGFKAYIKSVDTNYPKDSYQAKTKNKSRKHEVAPQRESLTKVTVHNDSGHDCEETNYDKMETLMGKEGSFNLNSSAYVNTSATNSPVRDFKMGREDLLKSFIMSEVLQRYDINRIYSRIPAVKSDD